MALKPLTVAHLANFEQCLLTFTGENHSIGKRCGHRYCHGFPDEAARTWHQCFNILHLYFPDVIENLLVTCLKPDGSSSTIEHSREINFVAAISSSHPGIRIVRLRLISVQNMEHSEIISVKRLVLFDCNYRKRQKYI